MNSTIPSSMASRLSALLFSGCLWLAPPSAGEQAAPSSIPIVHVIDHTRKPLAPDEVRKLTEEAERGDSIAQFRLGVHYGQQKNNALALQWLKRAAEQQNADALWALSALYQEGTRVAKDVGKAFELAQRAADLGCANALSNVGAHYLLGKGVHKDPELAVRYFQRGSDAGDPVAQHNLGLCCLQGIGAPRDLPRAEFWLRKSAQQGDIESQMLLASSYLNGQNGFAKNLEEGVSFLRMAAEGGNACAQFHLACYENDRRQIKESIRWLQKAAAQGYADAQNALGSSYIQGLGVPRDVVRAAELIRQAALQGHPEAQTNMGDLCSTGIGTPQNTREAVEWYRQAASSGYAQAQNSLGISYMDGTLPLDRSAAKSWFEKSAGQNDAHGQYLLGCIYSSETPPNYRKAFELFLQAARQGLPEAEANVGVCYYNGAGTEKDLEQAVEWLRRAYLKRQPFALQFAEETRQKAASGDEDARYLLKAFDPAVPDLNQ